MASALIVTATISTILVHVLAAASTTAVTANRPAAAPLGWIWSSLIRLNVLPLDSLSMPEGMSTRPLDPSSYLGRADPNKLLSLIADRLLAATTQVRRPVHCTIACADARFMHMPHRAVLLSTDCDFALDVVATRPRLTRSNIEYVILAGSSLSP